MTKKVIESTVLGLALLLAIIIGPALSSANPERQSAAAILAANVDIRGNDYSMLDPLSRDQLIAVIKCLTDGSGVGMAKCVARVTQAQAPATSTPSTLTLSQPAVQVRSTNYRISSTDGVIGATLMQFNAKSDTGNSLIKSVTVMASGTVPSTLRLYDGSTLVSSKSAPSNGQVVFDNLNVTVYKDTMKTLTIKADFPSNTPNASVIFVGITSATYDRGNGTMATVSGSVWGPQHYLFKAAAVIRLAGTPSIVSQGTRPDGTTLALTSTFPLQIQALGGNVIQPNVLGSDFTVIFSNGTTNYIATTKSVVTIPQSNIADGSTASVSVTASANRDIIPASGLYNSSITAIKWNAGSGTINQTWGLEDFKTVSAAQFNR